MKLVSISGMLADAKRNRYAVGAFNVLNLEMFQALVHAAEAENSPIIVQIWQGHLEHFGGRYIGAIAKAAAESLSVPIALQLDHGQNFEQVKSCIDWGFSSIMIDLSSSGFSDNINHTKEVVEEAHLKGISVEAELGKIFSGESSVDQQRSSMTDLDHAAQFVDETDIDALAVSVGTAHGAYSHGPFIDFELLEKLIHQVQIPIVIHGGSFTADEDIKKMIRLGVAKINIGTQLMMEFVHGVKKILQEGNEDVSALEMLDHAQTCVEKVIRNKIRLLNSLRINTNG